jgi:hypothetical protein
VNALRTLGNEAVWQGERSCNGVAILARNHVPVLTCPTLPGNEALADRAAQNFDGEVSPTAAQKFLHPSRKTKKAQVVSIVQHSLSKKEGSQFSGSLYLVSFL